MKPLNKENRQYLLTLFRSTDDLRPALHHNMEVDWLGKSWICTTNGHACIFLKDEKDINVNREAKTPNILAILPETVVAKEVKIDRFLTLFNHIPMITRPVQADCEVCDGDGKFEYYGEYYACKSCDEKGYVDQQHQETIKDPDYHLQFAGKFLAMDRFEELHKILNLVSPKKLYYLDNLEKPGLIIFRLDEYILVAFAITYFKVGDQEKPLKTHKYVSYEEHIEEVKNG